MRLIEQGVLKPQEISEQLFHKLEVQLFPYLKRIQFGGNNFGEPLLASEWDSFFERVRKHKIRISLVTNGKLLTPERIGAMVDADVEFNFSLEGATPESYEKVRGYKFEEFVKIVGETCQQKAQRPDSCARVNLGFTVRYDNIREIRKLITMAAGLGVDRVTVTHFVPWQENQRQQSLVYHKELSNKMLDVAKKMALESGILIDLPEPFLSDDNNEADCSEGKKSKPNPPCYHPWTSVSINEQGDVMPCCATSVVMGNMNNASFADIWNGPRYRKLRRTVNSSRPLSFCRNCALRGIEVGSNRALSFCSDEEIILGTIGGKAGVSSPSGLRQIKKKLLETSWGRKSIPFLTEVYRRHIAFYC